MDKKNEEKRYVLISPFLGFDGGESSLLDEESLLKKYTILLNARTKVK